MIPMRVSYRLHRESSPRNVSGAIALGILVCSGSAAGQGANPLLQQDAPANQLLQQGAQGGMGSGEPIYVADFIKPGSRIIYEAGSSSQPDPSKAASAGIGPSVNDVVAVTPSAVYVRIGTYLPARMGQGYTFAGSSMVAVNAFDVKSGGATWIDPNVLAAYQNDGETRVVDGPWEISGNRYDARSVTRAGVDSATRFVFDKGTGLLLAQQIATGRRRPGMDDPFMRENMSSLRFQAFRQRSFPWANAPTPEWAKTVRTMSYQGQQTMFMPGMPPYSTPIQLRATLTQRIGGVSIGTSETQYYQQAPQQSLLVIGPGSVGSLWMDPATLRSMRPGPLDLDPLLHSTLAYDFVETPSGRMGVLTESNAAQTYRLVWAYDLNDGALRYSAFEQMELSIKIEFNLVGRE